MSGIKNKSRRTILPDGHITFLAFKREFATNAPDRVSVRVIASVMRALTFDARGKASISKIDSQWAIRNVAWALDAQGE